MDVPELNGHVFRFYLDTPHIDFIDIILIHSYNESEYTIIERRIYMARRMSMKNIKEILRLASDGNLSVRQIAKSCNCSPTTVSALLERANSSELKLDWPLISRMSDDELEVKLYPEEHYRTERPLPDMNFIHREMKKKGVTLQLLWQEYLEQYPDGLGYSQFCDYYLKWRGKRNISMHQVHKAGEKTYVDWVGSTMNILDRRTGEISDAYLFVGVLGASELIYTEAFLSMELSSWITAHIHMFEYFGGVTEIVVPDNLKTGVTKACYYEPDIHPTYLEMARHYRTAIIPARVRKPKDKSLAELTAQLVERWIMAKHRNDKYFSLFELNRMLRQEVDLANLRPFQKMDGCRRSAFQQIEQHLLRPLPIRPYEMAEFKSARVAPDYHVEFKGNFYSTPYRFVKDEVEIRATATTIEILKNNTRIASHSRIHPDNKNGYNTLPDHMPESHRFQAEWTPERLLKWADKIGPNTSEYVSKVMSSRQHPEQGFRACLGILKLGDTHGSKLLEKACDQGLRLNRYSYKALKIVLDNLPVEDLTVEDIPLPSHSNIRGREYFKQVVTGGVIDAN